MEFSCYYGPAVNMKLTAYVEDGKFVKIEDYTNHFNHGSSSRWLYTPSKGELFKEKVREFIIRFLNNGKLDKYKEMIALLDDETLEEYFDASYLPK